LHMKEFWDISNTPTFSYILSGGTGLAVLSSLLMLLNKSHSFAPILLTFVAIVVEVLANIFYSFLHIDVNSEIFQKWVDLMNPIVESFFYEDQILALARVTAIFQGSFIPITAFLVFICIVLIIHNFEKIKSKLIKQYGVTNEINEDNQEVEDRVKKDNIEAKEIKEKINEQENIESVEEPEEVKKLKAKKINIPLLPESYKLPELIKSPKKKINYTDHFDEFFDGDEEQPVIEKKPEKPKKEWRLK
jgi:signal transduction histidine kinase